MSNEYNPYSQEIGFKASAADNIATDILFSATDHNTIAWSSGIIVVSGGEAKSIDAGSSDISGNTYIYFDGSSVLKVTTDMKTALKGNNLLVATAVDNVVGKNAMFKVDGNPGMGVFIDGDMIKAGSITVNELNFTPVTPGSGNNSVNSSGIVTSIDGNSIIANSIGAAQIDTTAINIGSFSGNLDNINDGATYKRATQSSIDGGTLANSALNASGRYKAWLVSTEMTAGTNPYTGLIQDSAGIRGYYEGLKSFEFSTVTGNGYFRGNIYAESGTFTGNITSNATITGGVFRTDVSGEDRVEINNDGLIVYDNDNYKRFEISSNAVGEMSMFGRKHGYYLESKVAANIFQGGNATCVDGHFVVGLDRSDNESNSNLVITRNGGIYFLNEDYDSDLFLLSKSELYVSSGGDLKFKDKNGTFHTIVNI